MIPLLPVSPVHPSESGIYFTCGAFIICNYAKFSLFFRQFHKNMQAYRKHFFPKVVSGFLIFSHPGEKTRVKVLSVFAFLFYYISKSSSSRSVFAIVLTGLLIIRIAQIR